MSGLGSELKSINVKDLKNTCVLSSPGMTTYWCGQVSRGKTGEKSQNLVLFPNPTLSTTPTSTPYSICFTPIPIYTISSFTIPTSTHTLKPIIDF